MLTDDHRNWGYASSTGLAFTEATIVDAHFDACRKTYVDLVRDAGFQPGWRVLDAGCGSGSFLPWLAELVGPAGDITAIDLAPEHAELAQSRVAGLPCPVRVETGSVLDLPYPTGSFDAVWCANTVQYLADDELDRALAELARVVRPGGLVAVKELDASLIGVRPGDPVLFADFFRRAAAAPGYARQLLRARELYRWFERAGLTEVRQRTVLSEHFAPFTPEERAFYPASCARVAEQAVALGAVGDWTALLDTDHPDNPLNHSRGYVCEGSVLVSGTVPDA
jgi:ubiquinone/menaquinone biosynthesis C-methylase UbiE